MAAADQRDEDLLDQFFMADDDPRHLRLDLGEECAAHCRCVDSISSSDSMKALLSSELD